MLIQEDGTPTIIGPYAEEFARSVKVADLQRIGRNNYYYLDSHGESGHCQMMQRDVHHPVVIRKTRFQIDGGRAFPGYTDGNTWNGWEMPYFELKIVKQVIKTYDPKGECIDDWIPSEPITLTDPATGHLVDVRGVGAGGWTWDEV
jgi:hypothetical protein